MKKLVLVTGLALALAACGGDEQQAESDAAETLEEQAAAMAEEAGALLEEAEAALDDQGPTLAELQEAFVADYAAQDATITTDSGLMYQVVREGEGASPGPFDDVVVHYAGRLVDGTTFDSSYDRDQVIRFPLNRVIRGWTEGLQYMQEGAEYQFVIPAELAYGTRGSPPSVPPNAVLVFDVELFQVVPPGAE